MDTLCSNAEYAESEYMSTSINCAFIKFNYTNMYVWVIPLKPNADFLNTYYSIKTPTTIIKSVYPSDKFNLIYTKFPYINFKRIQPFILDPNFPFSSLIFPGITCDQQNWIDQNKGYCAFHSVLHVLLRSKLCSALISQHISSESAYNAILNKLKDATIKTNSDDIINLLKILEQNNFIVCQKSSCDTFENDAILFAMTFLDAIKVIYFSYYTNNQVYIEYYMLLNKIFPQLTIERSGTLIGSEIALIQVYNFVIDEHNNKVWGISPDIHKKLTNAQFVLDGAFLENENHSVAGITCSNTRYIINSGKSVDHDWTTTYTAYKEEPFNPAFFVYVRIGKQRRILSLL